MGLHTCAQVTAAPLTLVGVRVTVAPEIPVPEPVATIAPVVAVTVTLDTLSPRAASVRLTPISDSVSHDGMLLPFI